MAATSRDSTVPLQSPPPPPPPLPPATSAGGKISPAVLFIIVILAVVFFISGLLHLLVRFLIKKHSSGDTAAAGATSAGAGGGEVLQRQLQQLFHLHDSGLDQTLIDALPVFLYREVVGDGEKEPFDCAVCLCEFAGDDRLRLLPACGHAFHIDCIDTWLLSNSTCPLCRGALFDPAFSVDGLLFGFDDAASAAEEGRLSDEFFPKQPPECHSPDEKRVFPVRLGKFTKTAAAAAAGVGEEGEASSSSLDARRCYSMGSYQYVVGDADLRVSLCGGASRRFTGGKGGGRRALPPAAKKEVLDGKKICAAGKGDSFSVSKIWQWNNNKGKLPVISSDAPFADSGVPWPRRPAAADH